MGKLVSAPAVSILALIGLCGTSQLAYAQGYAYTANFGSDSVSVIDTSNNTVVATVGVGSQPYGIAVTPDGTRAYVANCGGDVWVINTSSNTVAAKVVVGGCPYGVAITPDGTRAYVTRDNGSSVWAIDTASNTVLAKVDVVATPGGLAISPDGTRVYVASVGTLTVPAAVSVIDTASNTVAATFDVGGLPLAMAFTPDGTRAYVATSVPSISVGDSEVSVIDTANNTVLTQVPVLGIGVSPFSVAITPDGTRAYVVTFGADGTGPVAVIDTSSNTVVDMVGVGTGPSGVAISPDGTRAYVTIATNVTGNGPGAVSVIDTSSNTVVATVPVGSTPLGVAIANGTGGPPSSTASVLPQFAFGGGWYSALYFTNSAGMPVSFPVNFVSDTGTPLTVPSIGGSTTQVNLAANGTAIIEAPNTGSLAQGYAAFTLPSDVFGYGVFRQSVPGQADQEAVVPLSGSAATSNVLTWDDTTLVTAVSIVNPSSTANTVDVTLWDENGKTIGTSSLALPPNSKTAATLRSLPGLGGMVGQRGSAQFSVSSGSVGVLGLRFNGLAFTSIPTTTSAAVSGSRPSVLPQFAFGGGWYSALYFTNLTASAVSFAVNFVSNAGLPLTVPSVGGSTTQVNLAANGTAIIEAPNTGSLAQGYAAFTLPSGVFGYGVFRQSVPGKHDQEAVVPLSNQGALSNTLTWDDTTLVTAVSVVNPSSTATTVAVTLWGESGSMIGTAMIALPANGKTAATLRSLPGLSAMVGQRGSAEFSVTAGSVAVLGLRFDGLAFTSIPTSSVSGSAALDSPSPDSSWEKED